MRKERSTRNKLHWRSCLNTEGIQIYYVS